MTDQDREAFATLMLGLGETYGEPVSVARMEIYFAGLADLELDAVRAAVTAHVQGVKFFPRPAEIREAVTGSVDDRAACAWAHLLAEVRRVGSYPRWDSNLGRAVPPQPTFLDAAEERAAMELFGGWSGLCERLPGDGPELLGVAKNFRALYSAYARRAAALPPGETGRELTADEARAALGDIKTQLQKRGLPTGAL